MKPLRWINLILIFSLLSACGRSPNGPFPSLFKTPTPLPPPPVTISSAPDAEEPMRSYLEAFKTEDYAAMYAMLTQVSRDTITAEDFATRHAEALNAMSAGDFDYEILSVLINNPYTAQVAFRIVYHTALVGDISRDMVARLNLEGSQWKIQWDQALILPELAGGMRLAMDYQIPARGDIYDVNGEAIVNQSNAVALGIMPGGINEDSGVEL